MPSSNRHDLDQYILHEIVERSSATAFLLESSGKPIALEGLL
jgi:hypothetical protein